MERAKIKFVKILLRDLNTNTNIITGMKKEMFMTRFSLLLTTLTCSFVTAVPPCSANCGSWNTERGQSHGCLVCDFELFCFPAQKRIFKDWKLANHCFFEILGNFIGRRKSTGLVPNQTKAVLNLWREME